MGFSVPLAKWFRGPLREPVRKAVLGPVLAETGWFNPVYLRRLADEHQSGLRDYSAALWTLMMFESFMRNVVNTSTSRDAQVAA
jgi:asparagine synthase (glutamine-hydrolysing)